MGQLLAPHRGSLVWLGVLVLVSQAASAAGPLLLSQAIDTGLPRLLEGDWRPFAIVVGALIVATIADAGLSNLFTRRAAALSQRVLLRVRTLLFEHTGRLGLDFHQRYTSGRVISRQTNDVDALAELLESGFGDLVNAVARMAFIATALFILDPLSALVALAVFVPVVLVTGASRSSRHASTVSPANAPRASSCASSRRSRESVPCRRSARKPATQTSTAV